MNKLFLALPALAFLAACNSGNQSSNGTAASGAQITGAGSTFVYPVLSAWAADYQKQSGTAINYQSIGSGGGIAQVKAGTVDFGATDQPLASDELAKNKPRAIPDRDRRHRSGRQRRRPRARVKLKLTGPLLADIYRRQDQELERPGDREAQPRREPAGRRTSRSSIAPTVRARPSTSPITSARSARPGRAVRAKARRSTGRPASAARATKASPATSSRSRIRSAMSSMPTCVQNKMTYAPLQNAAGTFVSRAPRPSPAAAAQRRLGERQGLLPGDDQCAGRERLSDHRDDLHPDAQAAQGQGEVRRGASFFSYALEKGQARRRSSTMSRCPTRWCSRSRAISAPTSSERDARPSGRDSLPASARAAAAGRPCSSSWSPPQPPGSCCCCSARGAVDGVGRAAGVRDLRLAASSPARDWDAVGGQVRRAGADLRNARHLGDRADHRRPGQHRHRLVPDRHRAALDARPDRAWRSSCSRRSRASSTACGACSCSRRSWPTMSSPGSTTISAHAARRPAVHRPADRHRHAHRRHRARDHGHPVHLLGGARSVQRRPAAAQGIGVRARLDPLGSP